MKTALRTIHILLVCLVLGTLLFSAQLGSGQEPVGEAFNFRQYLPLIATPAGRIQNLQVRSNSLARFEQFLLVFDVRTEAPYPDLPFDPAPPPGLAAGIGVTVNAEFSPDNWATIYRQPAFRYQPYIHSVREGRDHFIPSGPTRWSVRFTPRQAGSWKYRLTLQDSAGFETLPASGGFSFTVNGEASNPYLRRGFLRVSQSDPRYFEFEDGSPFIGVGFNAGFSRSAAVESSMVKYEQNKMNFMRVWLSAAGINGSQWTSWASHHLGNDAYLPMINFDAANIYNGADVSMTLDSSNPCYYSDFWQNGIPVEPNTTYNFSVRVKVANVTGPASAGEWGFLVKQAAWLDKDCSKPGNGRLITQPVRGSSGWITVSGSYTSPSGQYWMDFLYLTLQNTSGGIAYIDDVRLWKASDTAKVNLLREPNPNSHLYFDQMNSAAWDLFIQSAERHGVYLKLVIDEKNEWILNHTGADGRMTQAGSNDNFYASPGTKSRWLQQAWWRYLVARWGYSPAIHSFEYVNEGDPYNGNHYEAANSLAAYVHQNDPSRHMVTTSFWAAFPNSEFWSNPKYGEVDYADLHAYISTGWGLTANPLSSSRTETNPANIHRGNASARIAAQDHGDEGIVPRGLAIQGRGEWIVRYWMKAENFTANCSFGSSGGSQRIRWLLDSGIYWGGKEGVIPNNNQNKDFLCTSPGGTFDWTQFSSDRDRLGTLLPTQYRIILNDDLSHELSLRLENPTGLTGTAWIDSVEIIGPSGAIQRVGEFDITPMDADTAWFNRAYADLWGGKSLVGARMPLVRGETGVDSPNLQDWNRDLLLDQEGIWLHNNLWGQINSGGMADLFWWADETIPPTIYDNYLTFRNFMEGIPINNGRYENVITQTSHPALRAWGQGDIQAGLFHLWLQNSEHTWKRVVSGPSITPISGGVTIMGIPAGSYQVDWWNTYSTSNPVFLTQTATSQNNTLVLTLPAPLSTDVAVKIRRLP